MGKHSEEFKSATLKQDVMEGLKLLQRRGQSINEVVRTLLKAREKMSLGQRIGKGLGEGGLSLVAGYGVQTLLSRAPGPPLVKHGIAALAGLGLIVAGNAVDGGIGDLPKVVGHATLAVEGGNFSRYQFGPRTGGKPGHVPDAPTIPMHEVVRTSGVGLPDGNFFGGGLSIGTTRSEDKAPPRTGFY